MYQPSELRFRESKIVASFGNKVAVRDKHQLPDHLRSRNAIFCHTAVLLELEAPLVAVWSSYGGGASYLSQLRLPLPVLAFSAERVVLATGAYANFLPSIHVSYIVLVPTPT